MRKLPYRTPHYNNHMTKNLTPPVTMTDPKAAFARHGAELSRAVQSVAESGVYFDGDNVRRLEAELADYVGTSNAITCASGTDAITIALMALGLKQGDEVITTSFAPVDIAEAARLLNIDVVFADIEPKSLNIDPQDVERKISPRTRAIIPVHLFGRMADMAAILHIARQHNLFVVENAAQAFGSSQSVNGSRLMAGSVADVGFTSFAPSRNLECLGDGGALFTNSADIAARIRMICRHGVAQSGVSETIGLNSRLDEIQAAVLRVRLRHIDETLSRRRSAALAYRKALAANDFYVLPDYADGHTFNRFTLRVNYGCRDDVRSFLQKRGIESRVLYAPVHSQPAFAPAAPGLTSTVMAASEVLSIPIHGEISPDDVARVATVLNEWEIGGDNR